MKWNPLFYGWGTLPVNNSIILFMHIFILRGSFVSCPCLYLLFKFGGVGGDTLKELSHELGGRDYRVVLRPHLCPRYWHLVDLGDLLLLSISFAYVQWQLCAWRWPAGVPDACWWSEYCWLGEACWSPGVFICWSHDAVTIYLRLASSKRMGLSAPGAGDILGKGRKRAISRWFVCHGGNWEDGFGDLNLTATRRLPRQPEEINLSRGCLPSEAQDCHCCQAGLWSSQKKWATHSILSQSAEDHRLWGHAADTHCVIWSVDASQAFFWPSRWLALTFEMQTLGCVRKLFLHLSRKQVVMRLSVALYFKS